jgi:hypothetical protein
MKSKWLILLGCISLMIYSKARSQKPRLFPEHIPITDCTIRNWHLTQPTDSIDWFTDTLCSHADFEFLYVETPHIALKMLMDSTLDRAFYEYYLTLFEDEMDPKWNSWLDTFLIQPHYHSREMYVTGAQYWLKHNYIDMSLGMYDMSENTEILTIAVGLDAYTGGAHAFQSSQIFNFDIAHSRILHLEDCFPPEHLPLIEKFAQLEWLQNDPDSIFALSDYDFFLSPHFIFDENGLHLMYNAYEIGPYVMGAPEIIIPMEICRPLLHPTSWIARVYK